jgi:hypothetical protein
VDRAVAKRGCKGRKGEALAAARLPGPTSQVGGLTHLLLDSPQPQDELRDYERLTETSDAFIYVAMSRLMVERDWLVQEAFRMSRSLVRHIRLR